MIAQCAQQCHGILKFGRPICDRAEHERELAWLWRVFRVDQTLDMREECLIVASVQKAEQYIGLAKLRMSLRMRLLQECVVHILDVYVCVLFAALCQWVPLCEVKAQGKKMAWPSLAHARLCMAYVLCSGLS